MKQTLVYKYYCEPKSREDEQLLKDQIVRGAKYRLQLRDIENKARDAERALEDAVPLIKSRRMKVARWYGYLDNVVADKKRLAMSALDRYRKELHGLLKIRWSSADFIISRTEVQANRKIASKAARALCGVGWGTYQHLEESHDLSLRTIRGRLDKVNTFIPFDEGSIAVHIQNRVLLTTDLLGGNDTFARIGLERYARSEYNRAGRLRPANFQELAVRVGTDEHREPIWCRFNLKMHRDLPIGEVKWIRVHRERTGLRYRYSCQIVVVVDKTVSTPQAEAVGVDLGWRYMENGGRRLAFAKGSDGAEFELVIPAKTINRRAKTEDLQSIRSMKLDVLRAQLIAYRAETTEEWFQEQTTHLHLWRAPSKFARLLRHWKDARIVNDDVIYSQLLAWSVKDRHLLAWESHNDRKMRQEIRGIVVPWCATLAERYGAIAIEKMTAKDLMSGDDRISKTNRKTGAVVAPFAVIAQLKVAAKVRARDIELVKAAYTSRTCSACHVVMGATSDLLLLCTGCGVAHDRDRNAATNIVNIASGQVQGRVGKALEPIVSDTSSVKKIRGRGTRKKKVDLSQQLVHSIEIATE